MALTPEQIQAIAKTRGDTVVNANPTATPSANPAADFAKRVGYDPTPSLFSRVATDIKTRGKNAEEDISGTSEESKGEPDVVRGLQAAKEGAGAVTDTAGEILKSLASHFKSPEQANTEIVAKGGQPLPELQIPKFLKDFGHDVMGGLGMANEELGTILNDWATKHPEAGKALVSTLKGTSATGEISSTIAGTDLGGAGANKIPILGSKVEEVIPDIKNLATKTTDLVKDASSKITSGVKDTARTIKSTVSDVATGKTEAEILATPKEKVAKLNPAERKLWFDNEAAKVNSQADAATQKIKADLRLKADATTTATEDLQKQLATASRDKVIELRPKIVKAMGEQSKIYRQLIDEEMAGKEHLPINKGELVGFVETQFADNPEMANAIKEKLGIGKLTNEGQATVHLGEDTTLGELYNKTKSLKQEMSAGAKSGTKVFNSSDKLTDDAIHTLTDFMKQNGVDFKEANQFWSKYAPIRNQLVSEAKPFLQTGTQTKTFANTLKRVAQGTDVNNENFINEVENLVNEPITKEAKDVVGKLDATKKAAIADKIEAENKILETQMAKDKSLAKLSSEQFEVERQARLRGAIKKVIIGALGLYGAKELGITKFFGL